MTGRETDRRLPGWRRLEEERLHARKITIGGRPRHEGFLGDLLEAWLAALLHEARSRLKQVLARAASLVRAVRLRGVRHIRPAAIAG